MSAVTSPPPSPESFFAAPMSSAEIGARAPSNASATTRIPAIRMPPLDQLRGAQFLRQVASLLFGRIALDDLDVAFDFRHEQRLQREVPVRGAHLVADSEVGRAPDLNGLLRGEHDLAQLRVAWLAELVRNRDDSRRRNFDRLEAVIEDAFDFDRVARLFDGLGERDDGD